MDHHEGQRVSRRRLITGVSSIGLGGLLAACAGETPAVTTSTGAVVTPSATTTRDLASLFAGSSVCSLTAATTQGPYHFDADRIRSDIREDKPGVRLRLAIKLQDSETCGPLPGAAVELWHCDAAGLYSGAEALSKGGESAPPSGGPRPSGMPRPSGPPPSGMPAPGRSGAAPGGTVADLTPADDKRYLRGAQVTNAQGVVEFTTIWPGWYRGRTPHIHAMVHLRDARVLTTQLMFAEKLNDAVYARPPYAAHTGRDTTNATDTVYDDSMLLRITPEGDGYLGVMIFSADADRDGR